MSGAICGGIISYSTFCKDPMAYMMSFIMPDKQYKKYIVLKEKGREKDAKKLFYKYARSSI